MNRKQQINYWVRRFPLVIKWLQVVYRLFQGRFTVGAVGVLLDDENRVLLVKHVFHPKTPWGLPGGWVGRNELPQHAVEREFQEETNLTVQVVYPLHVWSSQFWHNHVDLAFAVALQNTDIAIQLSGELLDYQWAKQNELPALLAEHRQVIELAIAYRQRRNYEE